MLGRVKELLTFPWATMFFIYERYNRVWVLRLEGSVVIFFELSSRVVPQSNLIAKRRKNRWKSRRKKKRCTAPLSFSSSMDERKTAPDIETFVCLLLLWVVWLLLLFFSHSVLLRSEKGAVGWLFFCILVRRVCFDLVVFFFWGIVVLHYKLNTFCSKVSKQIRKQNRKPCEVEKMHNNKLANTNGSPLVLLRLPPLPLLFLPRSMSVLNKAIHIWPVSGLPGT